MAVVEFEHVDIVFAKDPAPALRLMDSGADRQRVQDETGAVIGVADASIGIEKGEICVLMGLSGSGKSTLLRCVNGLNRATRGHVWVEDEGGRVDVGRCDPATLRRLRSNRVAMVFQQFALLPWRTVAENVGLGLELRGMAKRDRERVVHEKLELVGLAKWADKYAHELSGGMQQRVGLARAFATDADILLMDEPFSALDPLIREHLQDELLELQQRLNKTIIFVSHDLDEALKLGTHIAIMEHGRIVQYGEPEAIVLQPANEYVREFVAHMNPLNVLSCSSLMTPVERLSNEGGRLRLDWTGHHWAIVDAAGTLTGVEVEGQSGAIMPYVEDLDLGPAGESCQGMVTIAPDTLLKTAIRLRHDSGRPLLLLKDGRLVGVVGDDEIYQGMLRQSGESKAA